MFSSQESRHQNYWNSIIQLQIRYLAGQKNYNPYKPHFNVEHEVEDALMIHPDGTLKSIWNILISVLCVYSILAVPLGVGFNLYSNDNFLITSYVVDGFFLFDIILSFNCGYFSHGSHRFVLKRQRVFFHYIKNWFLIDLIGALPLDLIIVSNFQASFALIQCIRLLRLIRTKKLLKIVTKKLIPLRTSTTSLIAQVFLLLILCHFIACIWHLLTLNNIHLDSGFVQPTDANITVVSWVQEFGFDGTPVFDRYVASIYWTATTLLTVGYGDIHPQNNAERIFGILVMISGGFLFGALLSRIIEITENSDPGKRKFFEKLFEFINMLDSKPLPNAIKLKAKEAYVYYLQQKANVDEEIILTNLPKAILQELMYELFSKDIEKIHILKDNDNKVFITEIIVHSNPFEAMSGDVLLGEGDIVDDIFFVTAGAVRVFTTENNLPRLSVFDKKKTKSKNVTLGYITQGGLFGDVEFVKKSTSLASYVAMARCRLLATKHSVIKAAMGVHYEAARSVRDELQCRYQKFMEVRKMPIDSDTCEVNFALTKSWTIAPDAYKELIDSHDDGEVPRDLNTKGPSVTMASREEVDSNASVVGDVDTDPMRVQLWVDGKIRDKSVGHSIEKLYDQNGHDSHSCKVVALDESNGGESTYEFDDLEFHSRRILHPYRFPKIYWDGIMVVTLLMTILVIPVEVAFFYDASLAFDLFIYSIFFIDMIIQFRTAYESAAHEGAYMMIPAQIAINYLKGWFILDLISCFPIDIIVEYGLNDSLTSPKNNGITALGLLRFLKLIRVSKLPVYFKTLPRTLHVELRMPPQVVQFLRIMVEIYIIAHIAACAWWGIPTVSSGSTWYDATQNIWDINLRDGATVAQQYLVSMYFIITTFSSVGYGDIHAINTAERILSTILILLGASVFGYTVAHITSLLVSMNSKKQRFKEKMSRVAQYLNANGCSDDLSRKISLHFNHFFKETSAFDDEALIGTLPPKLRIELEIQQYLDKIRMIPLFYFIENDSICIQLFHMMKPVFFEKHRRIIKQDELANEMFFFVSGVAGYYRTIETAGLFHENLTSLHDESRSASTTVHINTSTITRNWKEKRRLNKLLKEVMSMPTMPMTTSSQAVGDSEILLLSYHDVRHDSDGRSSLKDDDKGGGDLSALISMLISDHTCNVSKAKLKHLGYEYLGQILPGDVIGYNSLKLHATYHATVETTDNCLVYSFRNEAIRQLVETNPVLAFELQRALSKTIEWQKDIHGRSFYRYQRQDFLRRCRREFFSKHEIYVDTHVTKASLLDRVLSRWKYSEFEQYVIDPRTLQETDQLRHSVYYQLHPTRKSRELLVSHYVYFGKYSKATRYEIHPSSAKLEAESAKWKLFDSGKKIVMDSVHSSSEELIVMESSKSEKIDKNSIQLEKGGLVLPDLQSISIETTAALPLTTPSYVPNPPPNPQDIPNNHHEMYRNSSFWSRLGEAWTGPKRVLVADSLSDQETVRVRHAQGVEGSLSDAKPLDRLSSKELIDRIRKMDSILSERNLEYDSDTETDLKLITASGKGVASTKNGIQRRPLKWLYDWMPKDNKMNKIRPKYYNSSMAGVEVSLTESLNMFSSSRESGVFNKVSEGMGVSNDSDMYRKETPLLRRFRSNSEPTPDIVYSQLKNKINRQGHQPTVFPTKTNVNGLVGKNPLTMQQVLRRGSKKLGVSFDDSTNDLTRGLGSKRLSSKERKERMMEQRINEALVIEPLDMRHGLGNHTVIPSEAKSLESQDFVLTRIAAVRSLSKGDDDSEEEEEEEGVVARSEDSPSPSLSIQSETYYIGNTPTEVTTSETTDPVTEGNASEVVGWDDSEMKLGKARNDSSEAASISKIHAPHRRTSDDRVMNQKLKDWEKRHDEHMESKANHVFEASGPIHSTSKWSGMFKTDSFNRHVEEEGGLGSSLNTALFAKRSASSGELTKPSHGSQLGEVKEGEGGGFVRMVSSNGHFKRRPDVSKRNQLLDDGTVHSSTKSKRASPVSQNDIEHSLRLLLERNKTIKPSDGLHPDDVAVAAVASSSSVAVTMQPSGIHFLQKKTNTQVNSNSKDKMTKPVLISDHPTDPKFISQRKTLFSKTSDGMMTKISSDDHDFFLLEESKASGDEIIKIEVVRNVSKLSINREHVRDEKLIKDGDRLDVHQLWIKRKRGRSNSFPSLENKFWKFNHFMRGVV